MPKHSFHHFPLSSHMIKALDKMRFEQPTEVQEHTIVPALDGRDLLVQAPTGTGKTAAFGIPLIENISANRVVQGLVLCPTRELAIQTGKVLGQLAQCRRDIQIVTVYGGESIGRQFAALRRKPQIVVATPGRLLDHMKRKSIQLRNVHTLIMDEADRMLDMGFRDDLQTILSKTPNERQTLLFSATMSKEVMKIAEAYQRNSEHIVVQKDLGTAQRQIRQFFAEMPEKAKLSNAKQILKQENCSLSLVFVNTKMKATELAQKLQQFGLRAASMHGGMRQPERDKIMRLYRTRKLDVLVATDVAARGIDVKEIDTVINYDLPLEPENYVHRIGRTGRAKQAGTAYTFICPNERHKLKMIVRNSKMKIERMPKMATAERRALPRAQKTA